MWDFEMTPEHIVDQENMQNQVANNTLTRAERPIEVGRVISVGSSMVKVFVNKTIIGRNQLHLVQLGTILNVITNDSVVVAMVSSLELGGKDEEGFRDGCVAQLNILGEITTNATTRETKFFRGVRTFPVLNQPVLTMLPKDLGLIFSIGQAPRISIGRLQQDNSIVAQVKTNDLLSKHFAIIGSTGSGKSCTVALILQAILDENPDAHVVLFDPHNEYSKSFGDLAAVITQNDLDLPVWLFDFDEAIELLTSDIHDHKHEEIELLSNLIVKAKQLYDRAMKDVNVSTQVKLEDVEKDLHRAASHISLDSPVPYRMRDVLRLINYYMGLLDNANNLEPYKRLKRRIEVLMADQRYNFIFKNQASARSIKDITGEIFRIPVAGKPICILDFSGIPSEALNIVVSVVSRLAFELAMWSKRKIPILLVCEEAHRYIPADKTLGFHATRRSISRIAKEGRKYGVSLAIISQRPSELEPSTLSQCSTIFSMRLSNERDQNFVRAAIPDGSAELLSFLPSLGTAEAMVFGESVNLPMRVVLNTLAVERRPHSSSAEFTELWNAGEVSDQFMDEVITNWRNRSHHGSTTPSHTQDVQQGQSPSMLRQAHAPQTQVPPMQAASNFTPGIRRSMQEAGVRAATQASAHANSVASAVALQAQNAHAKSKSGSLPDVKRMLNAAFHKNI
ncbi:MAG: hypothetical protein COA43_03660 [Robiginitomaculum sp.]|nr:MAG: hypothetical protein COA43_03660 [Robiginitomaculum sp.]